MQSSYVEIVVRGGRIIYGANFEAAEGTAGPIVC